MASARYNDRLASPADNSRMSEAFSPTSFKDMTGHLFFELIEQFFFILRSCKNLRISIENVESPQTSTFASSVEEEGVDPVDSA